MNHEAEPSEKEEADPSWVYPEVLDYGRGGPKWTVVSSDPNQKAGLSQAGIDLGKIPENTGVTDVDQNILVAPASLEVCENCGAQHFRAVRNHELVHAQWSPSTEDREAYAIQDGDEPTRSPYEEWAEEVRVNFLSKVLGFDTTITCPGMASMSLAAGAASSIHDWAVTSVVAFGLDHQPEIAQAYEKWWDQTQSILLLRINEAENEVKRLEFELSSAERELEDLGPEPNSVRKKAQQIQMLRDDLEIWTAETVKRANRLAQDRSDNEKLEATLKIVQRESQAFPDDLDRDDWRENGPYSYAWTMNLARELKQNFPPNRKGGKGKGDANRPGHCVASSVARRKSWDVAKTGDEIENEGPPIRPPRGDWLGQVPPMRDHTNLDWGLAQVIQPPRSIKIWEKTPARHYRANEEGSIMSYPHRWTVDRSVFRRSRRVQTEDIPGGSVLIDVSGSMSWNESELEELIDLIPAGVVATYSGSGETGYITILAADGKRVDFKKYPLQTWGGNVIDGPALEWLGNQMEPRVWVSDGHSWGRDGVYSLDFQSAAKRLAKQIGATRVRYIPDAVKIMNQAGIGKDGRRVRG